MLKNLSKIITGFIILPLVALNVAAQAFQVKGVITDANKEPLPNTTIAVKSTGVSLSDNAGGFE